jgi:non-specific serine/threonine protein kinase/serine/threonine-protein kinase
VEKLARAIHYAHEMGVLHRDLKPSNVLVDLHDEPHITDFGLAKRLDSDSDLTLSDQVLGTPSFMPPEQADAKRGQVGPHSDVYSLGALLYQLLTGRPPFVGNDAHAVLAQVLNTDAIAPRLFNPSVPRDLETIASKCLEKEPARRYESALALAEDLARHLSHEPIQAVPPSAVYRAQKFVRRHRVAVTAAAGLIAVLVAASVVSTAFGIRANLDRAAALKAQQAESAERLLALAAKEDAKQKEQQASKSAAESQAVLNYFLDKVLVAARPDGFKGGLGRDATIRAAIAAAEPGISEAFATQPIVEARIRSALGDTYRHLGEDATALAHYEKAYDLCRAHLGENHPDTLTCMNNLAVTQESLGKVEEAIVTLNKVLKLQQDSRDRSSAWIRAMGNLAKCYLTVHRYAEAVSLLQPALELIRKEPSNQAHLTATLLNNLGTAYVGLRRYEEGAQVLAESVDMLAKIKDADITAEWTTRVNLAIAWRHLDRQDEAARIIENFTADVRARLGPDHPATLTAMSLLATSYRERGLTEEATRRSEESLAMHQAKLGPYHYQTLVAMNNLAITYRQGGRTNEALRLLEDTMNLRLKHMPPESPDTLYCMTSLAVVYHQSGQERQALALLDQARERATNNLSATHPATLHVLNNLATIYDAAGHSAEAIPIHEETLRALEAAFGPQDQRTWESMWNLASTYRKVGREPDAHHLIAELLSRLTLQFGATNENIVLANASLAAGDLVNGANLVGGMVARRSEGNSFKSPPPNAIARNADLIASAEKLLQDREFAKAEPLLRQAVDIYQKKQPGLTPLFAAQGLLGQSLLGQKKYAEAAELLKEAHAGLTKRQAERPSTTRVPVIREISQLLVRLYEDWGKPEEAERWRSGTP